MKKLYLIGCTALLLGACNKTSQDYQLTGTFEGDSLEYVLVGHGANNISNADTVRIASDGSFSYSRKMENPEIGFLYVPNKAFYALVMINGTKTQLKANPDTPDTYTFTGDLEAAEKFYINTSKILNEQSATTYPSFGEMQRILKASSDSLEQAAEKISPKEFAALVMNDVKMSQSTAALNYIYQLHDANKASDSDADYNRYMEALDMNDAEQAFAYVKWKEECVNQGGPTSYVRMLDVAQNKISDPETQEKVVMDLMENYFNVCDSDLEAVYQKALPMIKDAKKKEWVDHMYNANKKLIPGADAIDCQLEDINGKTIQLSDLYGKVLYLDIWATWCGPCCEEIPYMEKLAQHFKGDNRIVPISISVDRKKKDWSAKLKADKPEWSQYLCPDFTDLYGIAGIPCFILIDTKGKIITTKAPRPSDPECINFISKYLK